MPIDWQAVRRGIAVQCAGVDGLEEATADDLAGIGSLPSLKVHGVMRLEIDDSQGNGLGMGFERRRATVMGLLIIGRASDLTDATEKFESIAEGLFVAARTGRTLGMPTTLFASSLVSVEATLIDVNGEEYFGGDCTWEVIADEKGIVRRA